MQKYILNRTKQVKDSLLITLALIAAPLSAQHSHHQPTVARENEAAQNFSANKRVEYDLFIADTLVSYKGEKKKAMAINGVIPGPTLYFTEGDTAIIRVHNRMHMETSVHWHGILLPNDQDGVPYLNTAAIQPGSMHTFVFPLIQTGTYWYHSHTMLQEQSGLYGSIVIHPKQKPEQKEYVVMLSDWTDENPHGVMRSLKRATDWYAIRKNSVQSWGEAMAAGYLKDKIKQEWTRMPAMDVSDVYYDTFLLNGQALQHYEDAKAGETVRLRIINGSASTYFWVQYAGGKMTIVSADGIEVAPAAVDKILIAVAETYDVLIPIPENGAQELRATAQDISGYASAYFGKGEMKAAPTLAKLDYFAMMREMNQMGHLSGMQMDMPGMQHQQHEMQKTKPDTMKQMDMPGMQHQQHEMPMAKPDTGQQMDMPMDRPGMQPANNGEVILNYGMLRSAQATALNPQNPVREIPLTLTGNMRRYLWSFDNKTLSQADKILIRQGENVRFVLTNNTMMRHPLHLHGHFFLLINGQGDYAPLKHTFDIQPMETVAIEFYANEEKDWFFHCHILYHMMSGMARVVSYEGSTPNPESVTGYPKLKREDNQLFAYGYLSAQSQASWANLSFSNNNYFFDVNGRINWKGDYETETHVQRFMDAQQFLALFVGSDIRSRQGGQEDTKDNRHVAYAGAMYLLPFFVQSEFRLDHNGGLRLQLSRDDMPLTSRLRLEWEVNTDKEYGFGLKYVLTKRALLSASYDSDFKLGGGLTILY